MRKSLVLATLLVIVCSVTASAGVPDPARSAVVLGGQPLCQYRFNPLGGLDKMTVLVTLRDAFDFPVTACSTTVTFANESLTFCNCCEPRERYNLLTGDGKTNGAGVSLFMFDTIGGRGTVDVEITSHCGGGDIAIDSQTIAFTSSMMQGDCVSAVDVIDVGLFTACFPPGGAYCQESDLNCDGTVDVIDSGLWSSGYLKSCADAPPCP